MHNFNILLLPGIKGERKGLCSYWSFDFKSNVNTKWNVNPLAFCVVNFATFLILIQLYAEKCICSKKIIHKQLRKGLR